jgi:hypothetical protein
MKKPLPSKSAKRLWAQIDRVDFDIEGAWSSIRRLHAMLHDPLDHGCVAGAEELRQAVDHLRQAHGKVAAAAKAVRETGTKTLGPDRR